MSYCWITDVHLDFLQREPRKYHAFLDTLSPYKGIIISGDIANANIIYEVLAGMYKYTQKPIYFVLGNHDYYGSRVKMVRHDMLSFKDPKYYDDHHNNIIYLTHSEIFIELEPGMFLCGIDGWADSRAGDFKNSRVRLNDSVYIEDLRNAEHFDEAKGLGKMMRWLSDNDTKWLEMNIESIITMNSPKEIVIVTHVPPFEECCLYQGRASGKDFLPFFCNKGLGKMLLKKAKLHKNIQFTVLCGHTHGQCGPYEKLPNLKIRVGGAEYYYPEIAGEI